MKTNKNKGFFLAAMLLFILCLFPAAKVNAGEAFYTVKNNSTVTISNSKSEKKYGYAYTINGLTNNISNLKVKSSNKAVATVKADQDGGWGFIVKPKKVGTTKITVTAVKNKKKIKRTITLKVVKFVNPFKTLKINGKSYKAKIKDVNNFLTLTSSKSAFKLNFQLKSGWKAIDTKNAVSIWGEKYVSRSLKNGASYSLSKNGSMYITIHLQNKKTKAQVYTYFTIQR